MCGIAGLRVVNGHADPALAAQMQSRLTHRGPDDAGHWSRGSTALVHRRLSIIDVAGSPQPMSSVADDCHVTFNGEIFNYKDIRRELAYPFRTAGDTEVLLAAYLRWGAAHVRRLEGQFAYAIHDERSQDLWLFRDRLGVLPLYYYERPGLFAFASEVKALLPVIGAALEVDEDSLGDYLNHRSVPAPDTLFQGVKKVRPGHHLRVDASGSTEEVAYWRLPNQRPADVRPDAAVAQVDAALQASVQRALTADVPVGAYLSGGLDSSLIVALMRQARPDRAVHTYAAAFAGSPADERVHARRVSQHLATQHDEVVVAPDDFSALWSHLTYHRDAPLSEPADVAVFRLAQRARRDVKVVLSGEGSDEIFAGYPKYGAARALEAAGCLPPLLRRSAAQAALAALGPRSGRLAVPLRVVSEPSAAERVQAWFSPFTSRERQQLLGHARARRTSQQTWERSVGDRVQRMLYTDAHDWLSDNLLERGDRMSMAVPVELRPPFLDRALVELAFSLPTSVKIRSGVSKWVVKRVARQYLPAGIVDRPKVGFRVPLDDWFRGGLQDFARDTLLGPSSWVGTTLDRTAVRALLDRHRTGASNEQMRIWTLLGLEVWHRTFFTAEGRRAADASTAAP